MALNDLFPLSQTQLIFIWSGIALLAVLFYLRQPATLILAAGENGRLEISRRALNRLVEACCEQLQGVASARAQVTRRGNRLDTIIRLKVRPEAKLDAIQGYLAEEVADIYRENLAFKGEVGAIRIKVVGVIPAADASF